MREGTGEWGWREGRGLREGESVRFIGEATMPRGKALGGESADLLGCFLIPGAEPFDSSPETGAEVFPVEGEEGIAGNEGTGVGPVGGAVGDLGTDGILQRVSGGSEQGALVALLFPKHMVMGLPLPLVRKKEVLGIKARKEVARSYSEFSATPSQRTWAWSGMRT